MFQETEDAKETSENEENENSAHETDDHDQDNSLAKIDKGEEEGEDGEDEGEEEGKAKQRVGFRNGKLIQIFLNPKTTLPYPLSPKIITCFESKMSDFYYNCT